MFAFFYEMHIYVYYQGRPIFKKKSIISRHCKAQCVTFEEVL